MNLMALWNKAPPLPRPLDLAIAIAEDKAAGNKYYLETAWRRVMRRKFVPRTPDRSLVDAATGLALECEFDVTKLRELMPT